MRYLVRGFSALLWCSIVLLALFFAGYWLTHRSVLSSEILVAIWQTNPQEAMEYLSVQGEGLIVLLTEKGLRIEDVAEELRTRHEPGWHKH